MNQLHSYLLHLTLGVIESHLSTECVTMADLFTQSSVSECAH